jgi:superfamily II RNA helicase
MTRLRPYHIFMVLLFAFRVSSFTSLSSSSSARYRSKSRLHSTVEKNAASGTASENLEAVELGRTQLAHHFDFPLDDWQLQAGGEILLGHNVIVCAPTGSG